jgi:hypothetical protein
LIEYYRQNKVVPYSERERLSQIWLLGQIEAKKCCAVV